MNAKDTGGGAILTHALEHAALGLPVEDEEAVLVIPCHHREALAAGTESQGHDHAVRDFPFAVKIEALHQSRSFSRQPDVPDAHVGAVPRLSQARDLP